MIDIPIIDAHLHIWDIDHLDYPWLTDEPDINRTHLVSDYCEVTEGLNIEKMVFLQCEVDGSQYQEEADWVSGLAAEEDPRIQGIVSFAPLEKGEAARPALERLTRDPLLKGVRRIIESEEDLRFCLRPDFIRGVQMLAEFGLSFDLCLKGDEQFENALELVRQCPEVPFILDHIGKPAIGDGLLEPWRQHLGELADLPNVHCKMSGLVTAADHAEARAASGAAMTFSWTREQLRPYIDHVIESFGFDRVMYGGDWPVSTLAAKYPDWVAALDWATAGSSEEELQKLYRRNAIGFYRLADPSGG